MEHYINISILDNSEFSTPVLMNVLCSNLHKALCDLHSTSIGISFPQYNRTLGNILRIHGKKMTLQVLQDLNWIRGMSEYCVVSSILSVPVCAKFRIVSRKQQTMSQSKLRRLVRRSSLTEAGISQYKEKMFSNGLDNPYFEQVSRSNGQKYRRYIEFSDLLDKSIAGEFDQFGLSKSATVPWFD